MINGHVLGWARSVASIANKPIKYAIADEIDKSGFDPGKKEAGPLDLIDKRLTTFRPVSKYWKISTPTLESGNIWKELNNNTDIIFDYHVTCPLCSMQQLMEFTGIKWEGRGKADHKEIKNKNLAWYECEHCQGKWDDDLRNRAVRNGIWMARGSSLALTAYLKRFRPSNIGFHIPAWISYFVSLSECAASFLEGLNDPLKMQDFLNSFCALPWKDIVIKKDEEDILAHKNHLPGGIVPKDAVALTCGIDVQARGFWFVVKSWTRDLSSHTTQYGFLSTWKDVETLVFDTRYPIEGKNAYETMGIWRAAIDTGGNKDSDDDWSKTEEIYTWVRTTGRGVIFPIKGESRPQVKKVTPRVIDKMSRGNRAISGRIVLYFLDTDKFKELFHWRLSRLADESQHMTLHADTDILYARQILAEQKQKDKTGKISWVPIRRGNHLLDCEIYAAACADPEWAPSLSFIASRMPDSNGDNPQPSQINNRSQGSPGRTRPSWFHSR